MLSDALDFAIQFGLKGQKELKIGRLPLGRVKSLQPPSTEDICRRNEIFATLYRLESIDNGTSIVTVGLE